MVEERLALRDAILAYVKAPRREDFCGLADRLYNYQQHAIPAYGRLAAARKVSDQSWKLAPLIPTEVFREIDLWDTRLAHADAVMFRTSGTTGSGTRGRRMVPDLSLYHAGMRGPFVEHVLGGDASPRPWISLIPPRSVLPDSSLSHMVSGLAAELAEERNSMWPMGCDGICMDTLINRLRHLDDSTPPLILSTSYALARLVDALGGEPLPLPTGTRLMLTGGFKGQMNHLNPESLLDATITTLGLTPDAVTQEYGMTELTSQMYGTPLDAPPWLHWRIVTPEDHQPIAQGQSGQIAFFDLLNLDNVSSILTSDVGYETMDGKLVLSGRLQDAPQRGCSLSAVALMERKQ